MIVHGSFELIKVSIRKRVRFPGPGFGRDDLVTITKVEGLAEEGLDFDGGQLFVGPGHGNFESTPSFQAGNGSGGERPREGGEQILVVGAVGCPQVRLQKHLGDPGGGAEIFLDLEGRIGVEDVDVEFHTVVRGFGFLDGGCDEFLQ